MYSVFVVFVSLGQDKAEIGGLWALMSATGVAHVYIGVLHEMSYL
jgi:hypothetical protein